MALGDTRNWLRQNEISGRASHPPSLIFEWLGKGWEQPRPAVMSKKRNRVGTPEGRLEDTRPAPVQGGQRRRCQPLRVGVEVTRESDLRQWHRPENRGPAQGALDH